MISPETEYFIILEPATIDSECYNDFTVVRVFRE